jgi:hypothetical protein
MLTHNALACKPHDGPALHCKNGAKSEGFNNIPGPLAMLRRAVISWKVRDLTPKLNFYSISSFLSMLCHHCFAFIYINIFI